MGWLADRRESRRGAVGAILGLCAFLIAHTGATSDVELDLLTVGQGYQTRTIAGELLDRSRVSQWASLHAGDLFGVRGISLDLQMRFDTDFALWLDGNSKDTSSIELMNFLLRMDGLLPRLGLTVGRQLRLDEIDFLEFDGMEFEFRLPWGLRLGLLGGFVVRDRSWLGGQVLELDGVEKGQVPAPVVGASLGRHGSCLSAGVDYRRVVLWDEGWPLLSERFALWGRSRFLKGRIGIDGGATYDLAQDGFQRIHAEAWARPGWPWAGIRLETGFLQLRPQYSLDSIFNFFSPAPFWQFSVGLRVDYPEPKVWRARTRLGFYHRAYASYDRWQGEEAGSVDADGQVAGVCVDGRMGLGESGTAWIYAGYEDGAAGRRFLLSHGIKWELLEDVLSLDARAILLQVTDRYDSRFDLLNAGASAGTRWSFGTGRAVIVTAEVNFNRINPIGFRMLVVLDLSFSYGPGGYM